MLSRRHLRIRVMQALYAFYQSENKNINEAELELLNGTRKIDELYLRFLQFFQELAHQEYLYYEDSPKSALTGKKKTAVNLLQDNAFIRWIIHSAAVQDKFKALKVSWQNDLELVQKAFYEVRQSEEYQAYSSAEDLGIDQQNAFIRYLLEFLFNEEALIRQGLEEKSIYWAESAELVQSMIYRTLENGKNGQGYTLLPLYKDEEDDIRFMKDLIQKTIRDESYFQSLISEKTKNWDADRIALIDIILMKMALCEILHIESVPVKVSINEYIDISKDYSTPNSKAFINGVIDKLVIELREQGKIVKTGRGLKE